MPDAEFMRRAIKLSRRGYPAPNPHVGCVIVRDGKSVGEGFHPYAGGPHAEAMALAEAGGKARGATVYVTLEPCNHRGRTPPCTDALIAAGVGRVVVACGDENPRAAGGIKRLEENGIEVEKGLLAERAAAANELFLTAMKLKRPYVILKAGVSLDGRLALPSGESHWITGEQARRAAHKLRAECAAIVIGSKTVAADNPRLTARVPGVKNQPVRVILDPSGRLSGDERVFNDEAETLWIVGQEKQTGQLAVPLVEGRFDLYHLTAVLFERGITSLLVEGGAETIAGFVSVGLVDRIELFAAPKLLGDGRAWVEGLGLERLADAPRFHFTGIARVGQDIRLTLRPEGPETRLKIGRPYKEGSG